MSTAALPVAARPALYRLAARLLLEEIDAKTLNVLRQPDIADMLEQLAPGCRDWLCRDWQTQDFDEAAADYCDLFLLNNSVSACAGAWLGADEGLDRAGWLAKTQAAYLDAGRAPEPVSGHRAPPDHLGLLLSLLADLQETNPDVAAYYARTLLSAWMPRFAARVTEKAPNPLYLALGALLAELANDLS